MVSDRLKEYFEFKGISYYEVEKTIQVSTGCISGAVRHKRNIGSNILQKILVVYDDLNAEWLFRGTGEMISNGSNYSDEPPLRYQSLSDNWLIDKMLSFFNLKSKNDLIGFFERIYGGDPHTANADSELSPFDKQVLKVVEEKYGNTLSNADELYAMYLQKLMREGEEMIDKNADENGIENSM